VIELPLSVVVGAALTLGGSAIGAAVAWGALRSTVAILRAEWAADRAERAADRDERARLALRVALVERHLGCAPQEDSDVPS